MKEDDLVKYIPKFGNYIAVVGFCKRQIATLKEGPETLSATVINRLKGKVIKTRTEKLIGNKNTERGSKWIEIGWFDYDLKFKKAVYEQVYVHKWVAERSH